MQNPYRYVDVCSVCGAIKFSPDWSETSLMGLRLYCAEYVKRRPNWKCIDCFRGTPQQRSIRQIQDEEDRLILEAMEEACREIRQRQ